MQILGFGIDEHKMNIFFVSQNIEVIDRDLFFELVLLNRGRPVEHELPFKLMITYTKDIASCN